ncbi:MULTISPECIES: hypothetical protein [unclassified Marinitoga]|uniref:hypothetical protein n=1 Tax=unclassified Marinitoga TaxID=2640159 RepID=UPI0006414766|nr:MULTISPECIES: hypothetical protein [unclassified Marinitoga]KLO24525.1 hypothetical protein X274_03745 [Marinitoga sp. 1155]NUU99710.1 hypothetical protein [Marinitoga sp. 1154]
MILYDVDKLEIAKTIPLPGIDAFVDTVAYRDGKYTLLNDYIYFLVGFPREIYIVKDKMILL